MQRNFASNNPFDIFVQAREHYKRTTMKNLEHNAPKSYNLFAPEHYNKPLLLHCTVLSI